MLRILAITFTGVLACAASAMAECTCSYKGGKVTEGQSACIVTAKGPRLARCAKFQNVTTWVDEGTPCAPAPEQS
jgi:hypothetical protein